MQNMNCIADLIFGGICHRFPNLDLVSAEKILHSNAARLYGLE